MGNKPPVKRWTARSKAAVVMDIFKGKTTVAEVARQHDLNVSEAEGWIEETQRNMENGLRDRPEYIREQYESDLAARVKLALERFPTYGYRRLACVLGENRKPIQRILQLKNWQVRKRPQGFRPRARSLPSVTTRPDERWATDLTHVWCGKDRRGSLAVIIDCCTREILGWRLSDNGSSK